MRFTRWIANLWPGSWHAWQLGQWRGLALAVVFGAALNAALITTFVWPQWMGAGTPPAVNIAVGWLLVAGLWVVGEVWRRTCQLASPPDEQKRTELERLFEQAQHEYLKGHWIETETLLRQLLSADLNDVEAWLLLATVQRRTKRWNEARGTLNALAEEEAAARWWLEIGQERKRIEEQSDEPLRGVNDEPQAGEDRGDELSRAA